MRKIFVMLCMMFGSTFASKASGTKFVKATENKPKSTAMATEKAKACSDKMITSLQLNNYQSRKVQEINMNISEQVVKLEKQFGNNTAELANRIQQLHAERDRLLENVLSTVQYNDYFGHRSDYKVVDMQQIAANTGNTADTDSKLPDNATAIN